MQVESIGERWRVQVGSRIYEFLHDGSGTVRMRQARGGEGWREVQSSWTPMPPSAGTASAPGATSRSTESARRPPGRLRR